MRARKRMNFKKSDMRNSVKIIQLFLSIFAVKENRLFQWILRY